MPMARSYACSICEETTTRRTPPLMLGKYPGRPLCDLCSPNTIVGAKAAAIERALHDLMRRLYDEHDGNLSAVARAAGTERAHVRQYMKRYGIGRYAK